MLKWVEVNLGNIASNMRYIRKTVSKEAKVIAVVKADAYGHGATEVSRIVLKNGADMLGVANIDEAMELRRAGIKVPILLLNWTEPPHLEDVVRNSLAQTIFDLDSARVLSSVAKKMNRTVLVHIKIDTGMGRLGLLAEDAPGFVQKVAILPNLKIEGIFSHLSVAGDERTYSFNQFQKFMSVLNELQKTGIKIPVQHIANSAATLFYPRMHLTAVRPGIIIYGVSPWGLPKVVPPSCFRKKAGGTKVGTLEVKKKCKFLKPGMSFKTKIVFIKEVPKGTSISYGRTFITKRRSLIADIPIGYSHGYNRKLSNKSWVLVKGKRVPLVGRICMDQCLIDVSSVRGIKVGDEVVLFGRQGKEEISAEELASWSGTIGYEVVTTIGRLVKRIYVWKKDK